MATNEAAALAVGAITPALQVREELARYTGQQQCLGLLELLPGNTTSHFPIPAPLNDRQRGQKEILDSVYDQIVDKDWLKPSVAAIVEQQFITRSRLRWGGPGEKWALQVDWLSNRPELMAWMGSSYWRHSNHRRVKV
jgi:hypothetical protein